MGAQAIRGSSALQETTSAKPLIVANGGTVPFGYSDVLAVVEDDPTGLPRDTIAGVANTAYSAITLTPPTAESDRMTVARSGIHPVRYSGLLRRDGVNSTSIDLRQNRESVVLWPYQDGGTWRWLITDDLSIDVIEEPFYSRATNTRTFAKSEMRELVDKWVLSPTAQSTHTYSDDLTEGYDLHLSFDTGVGTVLKFETETIAGQAQLEQPGHWYFHLKRSGTNWDIVDSHAINLNFAMDVTPPFWVSGSVSTESIGATTARIIASGALDGVAVTGYRVYDTDNGNALLAASSSAAISLDSLTQSTTYNLKVEAVDAAGNESTDGPTYSITTTAPGSATVTAADAWQSAQPLPWGGGATVSLYLGGQCDPVGLTIPGIKAPYINGTAMVLGSLKGNDGTLILKPVSITLSRSVTRLELDMMWLNGRAAAVGGVAAVNGVANPGDADNVDKLTSISPLPALVTSVIGNYDAPSNTYTSADGNITDIVTIRWDNLAAGTYSLNYHSEKRWNGDSPIPGIVDPNDGSVANLRVLEMRIDE